MQCGTAQRSQAHGLNSAALILHNTFNQLACTLYACVACLSADLFVGTGSLLPCLPLMQLMSLVTQQTWRFLELARHSGLIVSIASGIFTRVLGWPSGMVGGRCNEQACAGGRPHSWQVLGSNLEVKRIWTDVRRFTKAAHI